MVRRAAATVLAVALASVFWQAPVPPAAAAEVPAQSADPFVDSIGVNVHMSYDDTPYASVEAVAHRLSQLGVRHVRDGLVPGRTDQHQALALLGRRGIRSTLILGDPSGRFGTLDQLLPALSGDLLDAVEAVEGANEYDKDRWEWADALHAHQSRLYAEIKARFGRRLPVLAPSLAFATSYPRLAAISPGNAEVGNIHPYPAGKPPEQPPYLADQLGFARTVVPGGAVWASETGYHNGVGGQPGVSERAASIYLPRLLLVNFRAGFARSYLYELLDIRPSSDVDQEANFGLLRNDLTPKPAFVAIRDLIHLLDDGGGGRRTGVLSYELSGDLGELEQLLLRRCDGSSYLALWRASSVYDPAVRADLDPPSRSLEVRLARPVRASVHQPGSGQTPLPLSPGRVLPLSVGAGVRVVEIPPADAPRPARAVNASRRARALRRTLDGLSRGVRSRGAGCLGAPKSGAFALAGRAPGRYRVTLLARGRIAAAGTARLRPGRPAALRIRPRRPRLLRPGLRLTVRIVHMDSRGVRLQRTGPPVRLTR